MVGMVFPSSWQKMLNETGILGLAVCNLTAPDYWFLHVLLFFAYIIV